MSKPMQLDGKNYVKWRFEMKQLLIEKDVWEIVLRKPTEEEIKSDDWTTKNKKAVLAISNNVDENHLNEISIAENAFDIWKQLAEMYPDARQDIEVEIFRQILQTHYVQKSNIARHIKSLEDYFNDLELVGKPLDESLRKCILLATFPSSKSDQIKNAGGGGGDLTLELVKAQLLNKRTRKPSVNQSRKDKPAILPKRMRANVKMPEQVSSNHRSPASARPVSSQNTMVMSCLVSQQPTLPH